MRKRWGKGEGEKGRGKRGEEKGRKGRKEKGPQRTYKFRIFLPPFQSAEIVGIHHHA